MQKRPIPHRWRTDLNWLCGVRARRWMAALREDRPHLAYAHRVAQITLLSLYNSALARLGPREDLTAVRIERPLFVLGHWRSGTTWLHHLLAQDPERWAPTTFEVVNPTTFSHTHRLNTRLFAGLLPAKRVQDDVPLGFDLPEEDEYAIALLCGMSPYFGRTFPERVEHYERYLTLRDCTDGERDGFRRAMTAFLGRLTAAHGRPLVLKSPAHTARVRWLLEWFPDARFVHVVRDPYAVFASTRHLYDTVDWYWCLQQRSANEDDTILRQYQLLHQAWFEDRGRIPAGRLAEIRYEDLAADPMGTLGAAYAALDLPGWERAAPRIAALAAARRGHRNNRFAPLSEADRARVRAAAAASFDAWGYKP
jgi:omega-hydroxy-beta-dihydromenaquinone-9 sulfotransferase